MVKFCLGWFSGFWAESTTVACGECRGQENAEGIANASVRRALVKSNDVNVKSVANRQCGTAYPQKVKGARCVPPREKIGVSRHAVRQELRPRAATPATHDKRDRKSVV